MAGLTPKQEAFCLGVVEGRTALEAYKAAGYQPKATDQTKQQAASRLLNSKEIASRIAELRAPAAKQAGITLEGHLADLERLRDLAIGAAQFSAAITAEVARGKAAGIHVEKSEQMVTTRQLPVVQIVRAAEAPAHED